MALEFALTPVKVKPPRPPRSEHDEQCAVIAWARWSARLCRHAEPLKAIALEWLHAIPNGLYLSANTRVKSILGKKAVASGLTAGVADLFLPYAHGGVGGLYIEMKSARGDVTSEQAEFLSDAKALGYMAVVCYSWEEAAREIVSYLSLITHAPIPKE
jgi:hypothetical protein